MLRTRRSTWCKGIVAAAVCSATLTVAAAGSVATPSVAGAASTSGQAAAIRTIVRNAIATDHLRAVIVRVTVGNKPVITQAFGSSLTGEPATTSMNFRNGAVAFSYVATLLMEYVDEHKISLSDPVSKWMPSLPEASTVTVKMLANMTSGYPDYVTDPAFLAAFNADPFKPITVAERLAYAFSRPISFPPGTNWGYAHTNYMILGQILSDVGKKPLATLLRNKVLRPLGLTHTVAIPNAQIPSPVLHAYDSERRPALGIPITTPFYEESTYFDPVWGTPTGANETTNIYDMTKTAVGVGTGKLLSKSSYQAMTGPNLLGFGTKQANCSCFTQSNIYNYGIGIVRSGSWLLQNPLYGGYAATEAYSPSKKIAIAVAVTFAPGAFDAEGNYNNSSDGIFRTIGQYLAPNAAPPLPPSSS